MILRLLFVLLFLGAVVYVAPQVKDLVAPPAPTPAPRPTAAATLPPAIATSVATISNALTQAQQSGKAVPVTIRVSEGDLTAAAQPYFPQSFVGITVSDPFVKLGGGLTLTAKASSFIVNGSLVAVATPFADNGKLGVRLDSATVAGIGLPDAARSSLQQQLQTALDTSIPAKLQVSAVNVAKGEITITGTALP